MLEGEKFFPYFRILLLFFKLVRISPYHRPVAAQVVKISRTFV